MKKKHIHVIVPEQVYWKAKEVFPLYGELGFAIRKIFEWIVENPERARNFVHGGRKDEV